MKKLLFSAALAAGFLLIVFSLMHFSFRSPRIDSESEATAFVPPETFEETGYYYARLSTAEQASYAAIVLNIEAFPQEIEIAPLEAEALGRVANAVALDHPMLYMYEQGVVLTKRGKKVYFSPEYTCSRADYEIKKESVAQTVAVILAQAPQGSEYEKELFLHDYLTEHCRYDQADTCHNNFNPAGALLEGSAICSGYAKAYKMLLDASGIENVLITGKTQDEDSDEPVAHIWNAVRLGESWYYVDPTWDDPLANGEEAAAALFNAPTHNYFNVTDAMLARTHSDYAFDYPCTDESLFYYRVNQAYLTEKTEDIVSFVSDLIVKTAENGNDFIDFKCENSSVCEAAVKKLFTDEKIYRAINLANLKLTRKFNNRSTRYSVDETNNRIIIVFKPK